MIEKSVIVGCETAEETQYGEGRCYDDGVTDKRVVHGHGDEVGCVGCIQYDLQTIRMHLDSWSERALKPHHTCKHSTTPPYDRNNRRTKLRISVVDLFRRFSSLASLSRTTPMVVCAVHATTSGSVIYGQECADDGRIMPIRIVFR